MAAKKLTKKQAVFVKEYLIDLNSARAARAAGYSHKTAKEIGTENLTKPLVAEAIAVEMEKRSKKTQIDAEYVLRELDKQYRKADGQENVPAAIGALSHIGKHVNVQAFRDRVQIEGKIDVVSALEAARLRAEGKA